ncbi:MAG: glycoside hydrolase family 3 C-terminal domain-containing protein [Bacteroidales bacterium]|nr:glycoside hydrolase family 3 C-terminal domain-containing protein [Bacteroidales bacterium]
MKLLLKVLKYLGIFLLAIVLLISLSVIIAVNYKEYDVRAGADAFPGIETKQDVEELAVKLVSEMTLEEKLDQMYGEGYFWGIQKFVGNFLVIKKFPHIYVGRNDRLNIPPWVLSDGPRGAVVVKGSTSFPSAIARGASWDTDLERRVADVVGIEMRINGVNYAAAPCINLLRNPLWGRAQETYGEDPWHLGRFGVAYVQSIQQHHVMACPKHYALNSIENSRMYVDVSVGERTLREVYLPHFKKVIQEGGTASLMSAYNKVNGDFCGENRYLLTDILRDDWGFKGFVSTDWLMGLHDGVKGVKAGLDVEMPFKNHYGKELEEAIANGSVQEAEINTIVTRILKTRLPYAILPDKMEYNPELKASENHTALAREVAEKSMVLLKNEGVLPLSKPAGKKVAVIGRIADVENTGDLGSSNVRSEYVITPYQGIKRYVEGMGGAVLLNDGSDLEESIKLAGEVDAVILVVGFTREDEGEYMGRIEKGKDHNAPASGIGGDRQNLKLHNSDEQLIMALKTVNPKTVVTFVGGSAIIMEGWKEDVPAILYAWYSGMEGGNALARVIFGDVNPSGKLPFSIPGDENELPEFNRYAESASYGYYHGYTLFDKKGSLTSFPFGYGLSYTSFSYDAPMIQSTGLTVNDTLRVSVNVTNSGDVDGEEIVQMYVGFSNSTIDRPVKLLRGFDKVYINPGQAVTVSFDLPVEELAWYNPDSRSWEIEMMEYELYTGSSSSREDLQQTTFSISSVSK